ncbi:MAG: AAA-like domain protein [Pelotomaculum sp. PtaB.Bin104]|nr:MAG: AAA-like domain protein [Pelotomaculum sp. PtaB.Bin104]
MFHNLLEKLKNAGKTGYLILAGAFLLFAILAIILDVWLLGSAAAFVQAGFVYLWDTSIFASPGQEAAAAHTFDGISWYWHHPFLTARAWLTKPAAELSNPGVRITWLILHLILAISTAGAWIRKRYFSFPPGENAMDRDIRTNRFNRVNYNAVKEINRTPAGKVFLGLDDRRRPVRVTWPEMTEHLHILGGSGTGKTSFAVIPICLQAVKHGLPVVAIDFKGDKQAIHLLAGEARKAGRKFYFFSLHPQVKSNTYNPINSGGTLSKVERVMTALELVFEGEAKFYSYCQQAVFQPLLKFFDGQGVKSTLKDIHQIMKDPGLVEKITGDEITPGQIKGLTAALTPYTDLQRINDPEPDIDLSRVLKSKAVVYFDLRSSVAPEIASAMGKMIAMDLQALASLRTQRDPIALVAIDEFQNMACNAFRNIISKVRSANYALVLSNQALGDLQAVDNSFLNVITTNTRTKIVFYVEDPADAEYFARKSGRILIPVEGKSKSYSKPTGQMLSTSETVVDSVHDEEKHLIHANTLLGLPFGKSVIFRRGELAVLSNHVHLISKTEKDQLESEPYPEPAQVSKRGVTTAGQLIVQLKQEAASKREPDREQKDFKQPSALSGQEENTGGDAEVIYI